MLLAGPSGAEASSPVEPDWSRDASIPLTGRPNPYGFEEPELSRRIERGKLHAQIYPVQVSAAIIPYRPYRYFLDTTFVNPIRLFAQAFVRGATGWTDFDAMLGWLGLHPYPAREDEGVYSVPYPNGARPEERMGFGLIEREGVPGFSFSCATCHSSRLFGKTVLGMTNRFPRANEFFLMGHRALSVVSREAFQFVTDATDDEGRAYRKLRKSMRFVEAKKPATLGLDTSLAQVALSLSRRAPDEYASLDPEFASSPREEPLAEYVADSKPAVWWNLKYKTRWLSDGSVVSGNPIYTNLLWNEIGRGTDLKLLEDWLAANPEVIEDLTTAVFSTEAPRFTDFFPAERFDLAAARRGERVYQARCARCHGVYLKGWSREDAGRLGPAELLETVEVRYAARTRAMDVGTDPQRALGMESLARGLNGLAISRNHGIGIDVARRYVPPPLAGIWARWPYFHNNSSPTLCALLSRGEERPRAYRARAAEDRERDFDADCNGYPSAEQDGAGAGESDYDSSRPGLGRLGHDEGIILKDGRELLSPDEKKDLVRYLQTL